MSDMVERVAKALFRSRYFYPEHEAFWPDRLDELVNGPPFEADGYRSMARAAIEAMREPTEEMKEAGSAFVYEAWGHGPTIAREAWQANIDAALGKVDA